MRGLPAFREVLEAVNRIYHDDRGSVERVVNDLSQHYVFVAPLPTKLDPGYLATVVEQMKGSFDPDYGGFGTSQKFPFSEALSFLLQRYASTGDQTARDMVDFTLRHMAAGGIYDHVGGGFHRYATDRAWRVPHFEKMLNDNAQLLSVYLEAYQLSGTPLFREIAAGVVDFVFRELAREPAGFASSIDADTHGEEGAYYTWTEPELAELLGDSRVDYFMKAYNVTRGGNIGGANNVLYLSNESDREPYAADREKLLAAREKREKPYVDTSVRTSWTALMVTSLTRAYNVLGDRRCLDYAAKTARFILDRMYKDGTLYRVYTDRPAVDGYLEDYSCLIEALLELYNTTQDEGFLGRAKELTTACDEKFYDREFGGYFLVQAKDRDAMAQDRPVTDFSVPGSNPQMAMNLLKLYYYTGDQTYVDTGAGAGRGLLRPVPAVPAGPRHVLCGHGLPDRPAGAGRHRGPGQRERRPGAGRPGEQQAHQEDHHARLRPVRSPAGGLQGQDHGRGEADGLFLPGLDVHRAADRPPGHPGDAENGPGSRASK